MSRDMQFVYHVPRHETCSRSDVICNLRHLSTVKRMCNMYKLLSMLYVYVRRHQALSALRAIKLSQP